MLTDLKWRIGTVTVMLVTSLCWWLCDGDWFQMLVAESLCWRLFSLCWWFSQCINSVTNISNLSSTYLVYNIRRRHRCNRWLLNQHQNFRQNLANIANIQKDYDAPHAFYTAKLSNFISLIRSPVQMKLAEMLNN